MANSSSSKVRQQELREPFYDSPRKETYLYGSLQVEKCHRQQVSICLHESSLDTTVTHRDRVFVLGVEIPSDLQGDIYEMVEKNAEVELGDPELDESSN